MGDVIAIAGMPTAEDETRRWIVRIDRGALSAEERAELQAWLASDPRHASLLDQHAKLWHAAGKARAAAAGGDQARRHVAWHGTGHGMRAIAAGLCAVAVLALAARWLPVPSEAPAVAALRTAPGQHQAFALRDGSRIVLNTKSSAAVSYEAARRQVTLLDGEAYFEVAKDASRPFRVLAGRMAVRAVGTRFSVYKRGGGAVDVVVHEGVVEVSRFASAEQSTDPVGKDRLAAGQGLRMRADAVTVHVLTAAQLARALAWQQGRVIFDNTPLALAIEEMARYAPSTIAIGDDRIRQLKLSGSFSTQNVPTFLRTLEQVLPLRVEQSAKGAVIYPAGTSCRNSRCA